MTNNRMEYTIQQYRLAMLFWLVVLVVGFIVALISPFNYIMIGIGLAVCCFGLLGAYSTSWVYNEKRKISGDWSDLR